MERTVSEKKAFDGWCVLELMGHVRLAGRVTEEEHFGQKLGRIEVPRPPDPACVACRGKGVVDGIAAPHPCLMCSDRFVTQFFGGSSVYRLTPVSEEVARSVAARSQPEPVHQWELPKKALPGPVYDPQEEEIEEARRANYAEYEDE